MLSDEEKQTIEQLRSWREYIIKHKEDVNKANDIEFYLRTAINLIEKQSKEIEHQKEKRENQKKELAILNAKQIEFNKLVNTVNSYKGQFKRQQKEIEELKEKDDANLAYYDQIYQNGIYTGQKAVEDKIKAKIEYYEKIDNPVGKIVLQSLLEKE